MRNWTDTLPSYYCDDVVYMTADRVHEANLVAFST